MSLSIHPPRRIANTTPARDERESPVYRLAKKSEDSARVEAMRVRGLLTGEEGLAGAARGPERKAEPSLHGGEGTGRAVSILYAEDAPAVADAVKETLEAKGWRVEVCGRGDEALHRLQCGARFDVLIFDFPLPGLDGVELARRARELPRRRQTPIIMFTACEVERDARRVGIDAFLRKPRGVFRLAETVTRLLARAD